MPDQLLGLMAVGICGQARGGEVVKAQQKSRPQFRGDGFLRCSNSAREQVPISQRLHCQAIAAG
jgi:hypothetical protein